MRYIAGQRVQWAAEPMTHEGKTAPFVAPGDTGIVVWVKEMPGDNPAFREALGDRFRGPSQRLTVDMDKGGRIDSPAENWRPIQRRMVYADAQDLIARHLGPKGSGLFADRWSRWPEGRAAVQLVDMLDAQAQAYYDLAERLGSDDHRKWGLQLADLAGEIIERADRTS